MKSVLPDTSTGFALPNPGSSWRAEFERLHRDACRDYARGRLAMNRKDGSVLVKIPAREVKMGDGNESSNPKLEVDLSEYWIGVYCVTRRQYGVFVNETKHREPNNKLGTNNDYPVTDVSWEDCAAYAEWAGLSLPTEAQWENAARGPRRLIYPWGEKWDGNKCNNGHPSGLQHTKAVWEYPNGASVYGTLQQAGNIWEWCADRYCGKNPKIDSEGSQTELHRINRGGSFINVNPQLFRGDRRHWDVASNRGAFLGFRLVRNSP